MPLWSNPWSGPQRQRLFTLGSTPRSSPVRHRPSPTTTPKVLDSTSQFYPVHDRVGVVSHRSLPTGQSRGYTSEVSVLVGFACVCPYRRWRAGRRPPSCPVVPDSPFHGPRFVSGVVLPAVPVRAGGEVWSRTEGATATQLPL